MSSVTELALSTHLPKAKWGLPFNRSAEFGANRIGDSGMHGKGDYLVNFAQAFAKMKQYGVDC